MFVPLQNKLLMEAFMSQPPGPHMLIRLQKPSTNQVYMTILGPLENKGIPPTSPSPKISSLIILNITECWCLKSLAHNRITYKNQLRAARLWVAINKWGRTKIQGFQARRLANQGFTLAIAMEITSTVSPWLGQSRPPRWHAWKRSVEISFSVELQVHNRGLAMENLCF